MAKLSVEQIKQESLLLRGKITETLQSEATHFEEAEYQLLKFHGSYQQDDRDLRSERRKQKLDKAWSFMVRTKMPGGRITAAQYLAHDDMSNRLADGRLRLTTRQGIQLHGILKGQLKDIVAEINACGMTTWGACGDVVRNTMGPASPIQDRVHEDCQKLAQEISDSFYARSSAYAEIWLDGEKVEFGNNGDGGGSNGDVPAEAEADHETDEPIYGRVYLPRKFKMGIAVPPRNDVDIFSQDVGFVPHLKADGVVEGYTIYVGGGFGMSHGKVETRPCLAKPLAYVERDQVVPVTEAIVKVQREYGNRKDRKQARMKYLVESAGMKWFRNAVSQRTDATLHPPRESRFDTVADVLGWHEQGDGKLFCGVYVAQGRIHDIEGGARYKTAFRRIAEEIGCLVIVTPNTNLLFADIDPAQKEALDAILSDSGVVHSDDFTETRKTAHACVALPTCGLALAESERVFDELLDRVDEMLRELGLEQEPILIRMTGCPNGCARPYNADIAFVGRAPGKYAMYVGGSIRGDRLAGMDQKVVTFDEIPGAVWPLLEDFAAHREEGENFTDFIGRTREIGPMPDPEQFHKELEERRETVIGAAASI